MSLKYQVFISSTYEDLKTERDQVVKAVLEMGHIPVGMEMFSAADEQQWQLISRYIESTTYSSWLIVMVRWRAISALRRRSMITPLSVAYRYWGLLSMRRRHGRPRKLIKIRKS